MTQSWDLLIKGAKVFDGSGALPSIQDVAVRNGRVAARGDSLPADRTMFLDPWFTAPSNRTPS